MKDVLIMVSGSRGWTDEGAIASAFMAWEDRLPLHTQVTLLHGNAKGADTLAAQIGTRLGWMVESVPAKWDEYGKKAGILRNIEMLDRKPQHVFVFWDGRSRGTSHVIEEVRKRSIPCSIEMRPPT